MLFCTRVCGHTVQAARQLLLNPAAAATATSLSRFIGGGGRFSQRPTGRHVPGADGRTDGRIAAAAAASSNLLALFIPVAAWL